MPTTRRHASRLLMAAVVHLLAAGLALAVPMTDGFDYPVGPPDASGWTRTVAFSATGHCGEDWNWGSGDADLGKPVYAVSNGEVVESRDFGGPSGWGNVIIIQHDTPDGIRSSLYAHLDRRDVAKCATVTRGQPIGTVGKTGGPWYVGGEWWNSAHLHFEIRLSDSLATGNAVGTDEGQTDPSRFINEHRPPWGTLWEARINAPSAGSALTGTVRISGTARDLTGTHPIKAVELYANGNRLTWAANSGPETGSWYWDWDTSAHAGQSVTLIARPTDGVFWVDATTTVNVSPWQVAIAAPADGSTQSGVVRITGTARDLTGTHPVKAVELYANGNRLTWAASPGSEPGSWYWDWDTSAYAGSSVTLIARPTDGYSWVDATRTVNVSPWQVTIEAPADGSTQSGLVRITGSARDLTGTRPIKAVELYANGNRLTWAAKSGPAPDSWYWDWDTSAYAGRDVTLIARPTDVHYWIDASCSVRIPPLPNAVLSWAGTNGFPSDGVAPDSAATGTTFTYKVKYTGPAPEFVRLRLLFNGGEVGVSPLIMAPISGEPATGQIFMVKKALSATRPYAYYFEAKCGDVWATGPPTELTVGPAVFAAPALSWAGTNGFPDDGVAPNSGVAGTLFTYKVKYAGPAPDFVRLRLYYRGSEVGCSPLAMAPVSGSPLSGQIFMVKKTLSGTMPYAYCFEARSNGVWATGTPTQLRAGPVVTAVEPTALAMVTGLTCMPLQVGAQIVFSQSAAGNVTAEVLNIAGRPVRTIVTDRLMPAGRSELHWDGRSNQGSLVPNGTYLIRLTTRTDAGAQAQGLTALQVAR